MTKNMHGHYDLRLVKCMTGLSEGINYTTDEGGILQFGITTPLVPFGPTLQRSK